MIPHLVKKQCNENIIPLLIPELYIMSYDHIITCIYSKINDKAHMKHKYTHVLTPGFKATKCISSVNSFR